MRCRYRAVLVQSGMVQLKAYADGIVLPPELLDLLTDAFDDEGCVTHQHHRDGRQQ